MAWCMNPKCGRQGLSKMEIEFDDSTKSVLCHSCYLATHPEWTPDVPSVLYTRQQVVVEPAWNYEFHVTSRDGFAARIGFGSINLSFHAPEQELRKLFR